jgi:hypothetical protein
LPSHQRWYFFQLPQHKLLTVTVASAVIMAIAAMGLWGRLTDTATHIMDTPVMAMQHLRPGTDMAMQQLPTAVTDIIKAMAATVEAFVFQHLILDSD